MQMFQPSIEFTDEEDINFLLFFLLYLCLYQ